jgi:hypothetical protein
MTGNKQTKLLENVAILLIFSRMVEPKIYTKMENNFFIQFELVSNYTWRILRQNKEPRSPIVFEQVIRLKIE